MIAVHAPQDKFGSIMDSPALAEEVAYDPVLRDLKLVAGVSDPQLLPRGGERGFPHWGVWVQVRGCATPACVSRLTRAGEGQDTYAASCIHRCSTPVLPAPVPPFHPIYAKSRRFSMLPSDLVSCSLCFCLD